MNRYDMYVNGFIDTEISPAGKWVSVDDVAILLEALSVEEDSAVIQVLVEQAYTTLTGNKVSHEA